MHATGLLSVLIALLGLASASPASPELLERRVTHTGTATYYFQEGAAGACGIVHKDTDHVVALQTAQYANGVQCGYDYR
ncbi:hypothetical protein M422DRAFT_249727 [Sphaerobolus stellatus SS14]|uniref:Uncharacterized protein n=1 Tax=Sphaerobolus stellatus (strain SS14) TaxID=990650 RepID=A0A0C9W3H5_SPHS4|nr:hypothetical protein M422DRAFT_249727 [Sphaerobolus stellatus SS14]